MSGSHLSPVCNPDGTVQPMPLVTSEEYFQKEFRKGVPLRWVWVGNRSPWKTVDWLVSVASGSLTGANNGAESKSSFCITTVVPRVDENCVSPVSLVLQLVKILLRL